MTDEAIWAEGAAARLRALQIRCADLPPAQRLEFLRESLEHNLSLAKIPTDRRDAALAALAERFPDWQAPHPPTAPPKTMSVEELLEQLANRSWEIPPKAKAAFTERLRKLGFISPNGDPSWEAEAKKLQTEFGLASPPCVASAAQLLALLMPHLRNLDVVALETRTELGKALDAIEEKEQTPEVLEQRKAAQELGKLNRDEFDAALRAFLGAESTVELGVQMEVLRKHLRLILALMPNIVGKSSMPGKVDSAGMEFSRWLQKEFAPGAIKGEAGERRKTFFQTEPSMCWTVYQARYAQHLEGDSNVDNRVRQAALKATVGFFNRKV